ncbi:MAG: hypothetical protein JOZ77_11645 [Candidatus Eremiobacteraeota bacterium]|nr:hypothetical protein [Candidatus Eremiobacteraeota bacterium]
MKKYGIGAAVLAFICVVMGVHGARAAEGADVMATIDRAMDALNGGNRAAWIASCAVPAAIIDDIPPHTWQGVSACGDWWRAFAADAKNNHVTDGAVRLGTPLHLAITGSVAYVVCPATYAYRQSGKPRTESGIFTFAMKRSASGWLITAWSWTQHS